MKLLFLINHPETGASSRFRIYQYLPYFSAAGIHCTVQPFTSPALYDILHAPGHGAAKALHFAACTMGRLRALRRLDRYDVVVIHREAFPFGPPFLERYIASRAAVVFDYDDALFLGQERTSDQVHPLLYRWKYHRDLDPVFSSAAAVVAGNDALAAHASRCNDLVRTIPTGVDLDRFPLRSPPRGGVRVIGWIGSPSTQRHLALVGPALSRLHRRNAEAFRLRCVGAAMPAAGWPAAEYLPWRLAAEREHLYSFDIGIMPLYDTPWDRFKCAFKAILCMAAGIPVVASPVGTINGIIEDGVNGFLARDDREWVEKLTVLLADRTFYEKMSRLGRDTVAERFDIRRLVALWMDVLSTAVAHG